jgi:hypothetical protein
VVDAEVNDSPTRRGEWFVVAAAILVGALLALQGWRDRAPSLDLIPHLEDAEAFVRDGVIPTKGCLSSFGAYIPPGPTWLFAPGIAADLPGRLVHYPGTLFLFALTVVGVYLLGNHCFRPPAGMWCALVYAVSDRGIFYASSLWPRGHPAFVVWTVLFLCLWVTRRRAAWLGSAAAAFAAGMYVFMEILPLALAVPFVWLRYRPPIRIAPLVAASAAALLVWSPYLRFEASRDWIDLRAILSKTPLPLGDYKATMCDANAEIVERKEKLLPFAEWEAAPKRREAVADDWPRLRHMGIGLSENFGPRSGFVVWLTLLGLGLSWRFRSRGDEEALRPMGVLWRALLVPWLLLLLMPEGGGDLAGRRFWWLWPLQAVAATGSIFVLFDERRWRRLLPAGLVLFTLWTGDGGARVRDWMERGFGGDDAEQWTVCRQIAQECGRERTTRVGYCVEIWAHAFKFRPFDERYKLGWEWDWLLRRDFGVHNAIDCPEGVSPAAVFEVHERGLSIHFLGHHHQEEKLWESRRFTLYGKRKR